MSIRGFILAKGIEEMVVGMRGVVVKVCSNRFTVVSLRRVSLCSTRPITIYFMRLVKLAPLRFLHKFRFQFHRSKAINLAIDIMVAVDKTDAFYLGPDFERG